MNTRSKLFKNGGSQAVRLPKSCRFPANQEEVIVHREGRRIVIEPADEWPPTFQASLGGWRGKIARPASRPAHHHKNPFE